MTAGNINAQYIFIDMNLKWVYSMSSCVGLKLHSAGQVNSAINEGLNLILVPVTPWSHP